MRSAHTPSSNNAAEFTVARMAGKSQGHTLPPNWPTTKMALPIADYKQSAFALAQIGITPFLHTLFLPEIGW